MRYCVQCHRRMTMEELIHQTGGTCFDCFWPLPSNINAPETPGEVWRSDEAMRDDHAD